MDHIAHRVLVGEIVGWATAFLSSPADFGLFEQKFSSFAKNFRASDSIFGGFAPIRSAQELGPRQSLTSDPGERLTRNSA
ncbi:hypothetical protein ACFY20_30490 [Streptomyces sp. NPDC001312]|uniref:hypothetical protein n=1 Tax=Streptomyces sp. NPDC001312 TaxID=3364561 RepID=UPI0036AB6F9F